MSITRDSLLELGVLHPELREAPMALTHVRDLLLNLPPELQHFGVQGSIDLLR